MRVFTFALLAASVGVSISIPHSFDLRGTHILEPCNVHEDVLQSYRSDTYDFTLTFYKALAARSTQFHFVYSPLSVWLILAGMAEGADPNTRQQLFNLLNIPNDDCTRQKYYQLATSHIVQADDIKVINNRVLLLDAGVTPKPSWYDIVTRNNLLDVLSAPIRHNPAVTTTELKKLAHAELTGIDFSGNSVILDTVDYNALWTTEFADARIERSPFHDQNRNQIGFVDLMKVTKRARLGYVKSQKFKVLDLPIGVNERYRMVFALFPALDDIRTDFKPLNNDFMFEMFESFKESYVPVEVAIPRFVISSEFDVKSVIEDLGVTRLWNDPAATRNVSYPPALPSSFIHRATLTLDNRGLYPSPVERSTPFGAATGLDPEVGSDFIADRPFLYALFDAETFTCIMGSAFSEPTYKNL